MKVFIIYIVFCAMVIASQGYALDPNFIQDNKVYFDKLRDLALRVEDGNIFEATVNTYGDKLVENLDTLVKNQGYDPLPVDDIKKGYWWGNLKLKQVHFDGLASLYRCADAKVTYDHETKRLQIDLPLGFKDLRFESNYKASLIGIGPRGTLTGEVTHLEMITSLLIDYEINQCFVNDYRITKSGHISIKLHGNPLTDWANNLMMNATTALFKGLILDIVDDMVLSILNSIVDILNNLLSSILG